MLWLLVSYFMLPERMAVIFDLQGSVVGWTSRNVVICLMAGTPLLMLGLFWCIARLAIHFPKLLPIPRRDFWLAPERRKLTSAVLLNWLLGFAALFTFALGVLHMGVVEAHDHSPPRFEVRALPLLLIGVPIGLVIGFFGLMTQLFGCKSYGDESAAHCIRSFIVVGRREDRAIIHWPGVCLSLIVTVAVMVGTAVGASYVLESRVNSTAILIAIFSAIMVTGIRIRRGSTMPVAALMGLDDAQPRSSEHQTSPMGSRLNC